MPGRAPASPARACRLRGVAPLLFLTLLAARLAGAAEPPRGLTLAEARRLAAERGWAVAAASAGLRQAEGEGRQSHAWPNPTLSLSAQKLNVTPAGEGGSSSDSTIGLSQLVELGGKRASRIKAAEAALASAREQLAGARLAQDALVVKAYAAALAATESARVSRESSDSLSRAAAIAEARLSAGEISVAERDQTRVAAGRFAADARSAESAALQSRVALQTLLGVAAPDGEVLLADGLASLSQLAGSQATATGSAEQAALDGRADVRAARARAEQARAQAALQRAQRVPDLSFFVQYESDRPANTNTVGAGVSLPVPVFDRNRGAITAAQAAVEQAESEARRVRAQATAELASARAALLAALDKRRLYRDELLPRAESVRQSVAFSYQKGLASLLELLEAERSLNDVRLAGVLSDAEALSAAADLAAARGEALP